MKKMITLSAFFLFLIVAGANLAQAASVGTPAQEMLNTVDVICPQLGRLNDRNIAEEDLFNRCGEARNEEDDNIQNNAALQLTSEETNVMETVSVDVTHAQFSSVLSRIATLRGQGGRGTLAVNFSTPNENSMLSAKAPLIYNGTIGTGAPLESAVDIGTFAINPNASRVFGGRLGVFINGGYTTGDVDATINEPGFDHDGYSLTIGTDYRLLDNFFIGVAASYVSTSAELNNSAGDTDADGYGFSVYSTYNYGDLYFDIVGGYGAKDYETIRRVNYTISAADGGTSAVQQTFTGDTDAKEWALSLGVGYDFFVSGFNISPYGRLGHFTSDIDGYTEALAATNTNTGFGLGLRLDDQDFDSTTTDLGAQVSYPISSGIGVFTPYGRFEWEHEYDKDARIIQASYINGTRVTGNVIRIPTDEPDRDYFNLGVGVSGVFPYGVQAFVEYATIIGLDNVTSNTIGGGVRLEF